MTSKALVKLSLLQSQTQWQGVFSLSIGIIGLRTYLIYWCIHVLIWEKQGFEDPDVLFSQLLNFTQHQNNRHGPRQSQAVFSAFGSLDDNSTWGNISCPSHSPSPLTTDSHIIAPPTFYLASSPQKNAPLFQWKLTKFKKSLCL